MRLLSIAPLFVAAASAQAPKTFYEGLSAQKPTPELFEQALKVCEQLATLPKNQVIDLLPVLFKAIQDDKLDNKHAALGLYSISRRPDFGEILKSHMKDIAALLASPDGALKATAGTVMINMNPQPPEAADMLLAFINGNGPLNQKIDALSALRSLANPP